MLASVDGRAKILREYWYVYGHVFRLVTNSLRASGNNLYYPISFRLILFLTFHRTPFRSKGDLSALVACCGAHGTLFRCVISERSVVFSGYFHLV